MKRWNRRIETNILACYNRASAMDVQEGLNWYSRAHDEAQALAVAHRIEVWQAVGVIAA